MRNLTAWAARDYTTEFSKSIEVFKTGLPRTVVRFVDCTKHLAFNWH